MKITAKVRCQSRTEIDADQDRVTFAANYTDPDGERVNTEWAKYTPCFSIDMVVLKSVPFVAGKAYTLTFDDGE